VLRCSAAAALGLPLALTERLSVPPAALLVLDWPVDGHLAAAPILCGLDLDQPLTEGTAWYQLPRPESRPRSGART
jgi:hypothetical protein